MTKETESTKCMAAALHTLSKIVAAFRIVAALKWIALATIQVNTV